MTHLDSNELGKILLLQSALQSVDEPARLGEIVCQGFVDFPGVLGVCFHLADDMQVTTSGYDADGNNGAETSVSLQVAGTTFGVVRLRVDQKKAFEPYRPYFQNTANLVAVLLQKQKRESILEQLTDDLDEKVRERTIALERANRELREEIAARSTAEESMQRSLKGIQTAHNQIEAILHSVPHPLLVLNNCLHVILMNQNAEKLLGLKQGSRGLPPLRKLISPLPCSLEQCTFPLEEPLFCEDFELMDHERGARRLFTAQLSPVKGVHGQGQGAGMILQLQDVNRERRLSQMKDEFISTAAHELNTPLTAMLGYLELLLNPDMLASVSLEERKTFLTTVFEKAQMLSHLVDELLNVSRIESGVPLPLKKMTGVFAAMVQEVAWHYQARNVDHHLRLELGDGVERLAVDREKMEQVFHNLLSNAVKYAPQGGDIHIRGTAQAGGYLLEVEDQGVGMTPAQVKNIFDKFYRVDASNTAVSGLGLGMTIVKQIIEAHQGTIDVESRIGEGTTVRVWLPWPNSDQTQSV